MSKKKPSKKTAPKKTTSKKIASKKTTRPAKVKKSRGTRGSKEKQLQDWKQRPGTFTYDLQLSDGIKWICHAKRQLNEEELCMQYILHNTFDISGPLKPGETKIINAVDDPVASFVALLKNPPPGWVQYAKGKAIEHLIVSRQQAQKKLRQSVLAKQKNKKKLPLLKNGVCVNCHGRLWVCEIHPTLPWEMQDASGCPCSAPGQACPDCHPKATSEMGPPFSPFKDPKEKTFKFPFSKQGDFGLPFLM